MFRVILHFLFQPIHSLFDIFKSKDALSCLCDWVWYLFLDRSVLPSCQTTCRRWLWRHSFYFFLSPLFFSVVGRTYTKESWTLSKTLGMLVRYGNLVQTTDRNDSTSPITHLINKTCVSALFMVRFGEESMKRVLRWMDKASIPENAAILDIGTGNGAFLVELVWEVKHLIFVTLSFDFQGHFGVVIQQ